ncbi:MAG TPA: hypothetical protein VGD60_07670 [Candidatus Acidoferrales bacterium]
MNNVRFPIRVFAILVFAVLSLNAPGLRAQETGEPDSATALSNALAAACKADEAQFASFLAGENPAAFRALPAAQRVEFVKRISLTDLPGKPLISSDGNGHIVLHCRAPNLTVEYRFGTPRVHENLAFITVAVVDSEEATFGLIHESKGWKLLSLGLVLFDIPQLSKQWAQADLIAHEEGTVATLRTLSEAIQTYHRAFGRLPENLAELGPAPKDQISPEQASLISAGLATGSQDGYEFRYRIVPDISGNDTAFELAATPKPYGNNGHRSFFLDAAGKVHGDDKHGAVATTEDPLIAGEKAATEKSE